jgi:ABC-type uncharacterized transport system permease subunit
MVSLAFFSVFCCLVVARVGSFSLWPFGETVGKGGRSWSLLDLHASTFVGFGIKFSDEARWFIQEMVPLLKQFECQVGICLQDPEEKVIFQKCTSKILQMILTRESHGSMVMLRPSLT